MNIVAWIVCGSRIRALGIACLGLWWLAPKEVSFDRKEGSGLRAASYSYLRARVY